MAAFFDYELPDRLIAQHPTARRDAARLMVVDRATGSISHRTIADLPDLLRSGDRLVLNDTRVIPARVVGLRESSGGQWEGLYLRDCGDGTWEFLAKTRGYPQGGEWFALNPTEATDRQTRLQLVGRTADRHWLMKPEEPADSTAWLDRFGHMPLPHYIRDGNDGPDDRVRYQTVFARQAGSVAAPTAGLHFTPELLAKLQANGVSTSHVTLHVGLGTFAQVKASDPTQHRLHAEWAEVTEATAAELRAALAAGQRLIAVGTTVARTLETACRRAELGAQKYSDSSTPHPSKPTVSPTSPTRGEVEDNCLHPSTSPLVGEVGERSETGGGCHNPLEHPAEPGLRAFRAETDLFIHEPFEFRAVGGLLTNFHLPKTTLLLLVGAWCGSDLLRRAYEEAIRAEYRFFSYGDAMLIA